MFVRKRRAAYEWIQISPRLPTYLFPTIAPAAKNTFDATIPVSLPTAPRVPMSFTEALAAIGVPGSNLSPEEELVDLLQNAAEIEHGLMLQYLYAMYSAKLLIVSSTMTMIAIEEMGHFISVQNVLVACGQTPYLGHSDWNDPTLFHPFPFKLEPASAGTLAKYTIAEMPDPKNVPADIQSDLPAILAEAEASAGSAVAAHRVGLLYAKIYWLLRADDNVLPDPSQEPWIGFPVEELAANPKLAGRHIREGFVVDATNHNALPEHWKGTHQSVIVTPISNRTDALQAIASISAQGEGFGDVPQGHFERFVEAWRLTKRSNDVITLAPTNPWYSSDSGSSGPLGGDEITSIVGRQFARMGDLSYELILLATAANLLLPSGTANSIKGKVAKAARIAMKDCVGMIAADALAKIPLREGESGDSLVCGLPFSAVPLEIASELPSVLDRARAVAAEIQAIVDLIDQGAASSTLKGLAQGVGLSVRDDIIPKLEALLG